MTPPRYPLPDTRQSLTHSFDICLDTGEKKSFYVTCGMYNDGRLGEIFIEHGMEGSFLGRALDNLAMAMSIGLQYGVPLEVYTAKLRGQRVEPGGIVEKTPEGLLDHLREMGIMGERPYYICPSVFDYLAHWLEYRFPEGKRREENV